MAQLRQEYQQFTARDTEVIVVGPDGPKAFQSYWEKHQLPYPGLADPEHKVAKLYGQDVKPLKLGRMPALLLIDKAGFVRYQHYGGSMGDISQVSDIVSILDSLQRNR